MTPDEWRNHMYNRVMKQFRMEDKVVENSIKPQLLSPDVANTCDFVFSPVKPLDRIGDSGPLLLAKRKTNRSEKYLVKHAFCDCAANEFVYTKLVQAMGYKMPNVVLFSISPEEKRKYFKTEYIIGAKYLNLVNTSPSYREIREQATNWREYFSFWALYLLTQESDGFETPLADDGFIYRVDTTDAFPLDDINLSQAGINHEFDGINPKEVWKEKLLGLSFKDSWKVGHFDYWLQKYTEKHGQECIVPYLEPFQRIQEISVGYVDDFLHTLCYFYPDFIGDVFQRYIGALKDFACEYLKTKR